MAHNIHLDDNENYVILAIGDDIYLRGDDPTPIPPFKDETGATVTPEVELWTSDEDQDCEYIPSEYLADSHTPMSDRYMFLVGSRPKGTRRS